MAVDTGGRPRLGFWSRADLPAGVHGGPPPAERSGDPGGDRSGQHRRSGGADAPSLPPAPTLVAKLGAAARRPGRRETASWSSPQVEVVDHDRRGDVFMRLLVSVLRGAGMAEALRAGVETASPPSRRARAAPNSRAAKNPALLQGRGAAIGNFG